MANAWNRNKVDSSTINNGNEYEKGDRVSRQNLNAMVNAGLFAQDFAEKLVTNIDTSEIGNVGTPSIVLVDGDGATTNKPYKKFKFSNLKGDKGETGDKGDTIELRVSDGYFQWKYTQDTVWKNLIATSEISNVDQILSDTSTNAIANKAVTEEFRKTVYQSDFENENTTSFGDYIVEKKKVLWEGSQNILTNPIISIEGNFQANKTYRMYIFHLGEYKYIYFKTNSDGSLSLPISTTRLQISGNATVPSYFWISTGIAYIDSTSPDSIMFSPPKLNKYYSTSTTGTTITLTEYDTSVLMTVYEISEIIN